MYCLLKYFIFKNKIFNINKIINYIMECSVCFNNCNNKNIITCPYCNNQYCNNCLKEYLMNYGGLECLNCKKKINITFISKYFTKKWLKNDYIKRYGSFCLLSEDTILNNLMDTIHIYNIIYQSKLNNTFKLINNYFLIKKLLLDMDGNEKYVNACLNEIYTINDIIDIINLIILEHNDCLIGYNKDEYFKNLCAFLPCLIDKIKFNNPIDKNKLKNELNINNHISLFQLLFIFQENINKEVNNNKLAKNMLEYENIFYNDYFNNSQYFYNYDYSLEKILSVLIYGKKNMMPNNTYMLYDNINLDVNKNINFILKFYNGLKNNISNNSSIKKCIKNNCRGFLKEDKTEITKEEFDKHNKDINDKEIDDFNYIHKSIKNANNVIDKYYKINFLICKLCNCKICSNCNKEFNDNHKCNDDDIITILSIKQGAKNCPGCNIPIFKTEGCDHMFCVNCHCMFNWSNLKITKTTTNPLYYEWMRNRGLTPNRNDANEHDRNMGYCDVNIYNGYELKYLIKKYNIMNYDDRYYNLSNIFEKLQNYSLHDINDYNKIRIKYLLNLIDENEYKNNISKFDIENYYINEYNDIFNTFRFNINDTLHSLFNQLNIIRKKEIVNSKINKTKDEYVNAIKNHSNIIENFINQFNNNMIEYKNLTILSRKSFIINNNWFLNENIKKLNSTIVKNKKILYDKMITLLFYKTIHLNKICFIIEVKDIVSDFYKLFDYMKNVSSFNNSLILKYNNIYKNNKNKVDKLFIYLKDVYLNKKFNNYNINKIIDSFIVIFNSIEDNIIELNDNNIEKMFIEFEKIKSNENIKLDNLIKLFYDILDYLK